MKKQFASLARKDINEQKMYRNRNRRVNIRMGTMYDHYINEGLDNGNNYHFVDRAGKSVTICEGDVVLRADKYTVHVYRRATATVERYRKPRHWATVVQNQNPYTGAMEPQVQPGLSKPIALNRTNPTFQVGEEVRLGSAATAQLNNQFHQVVTEAFILCPDNEKELSPLEQLLAGSAGGYWIVKVFPRGKEVRVRVFGSQIFKKTA